MYNQREIVFVPFPYSDLSSSKRRPVLVVSNNNYNRYFSDILVYAITSSFSLDAFPVSLTDADLDIGKLPVESVIKCHKLFTVEQSLIVKRFSIIKEAKFDEVRKVIQQLIQT